MRSGSIPLTISPLEGGKKMSMKIKVYVESENGYLEFPLLVELIREREVIRVDGELLRLRLSTKRALYAYDDLDSFINELKKLDESLQEDLNKQAEKVITLIDKLTSVFLPSQGIEIVKLKDC